MGRARERGLTACRGALLRPRRLRSRYHVVCQKSVALRMQRPQGKAIGEGCAPWLTSREGHPLPACAAESLAGPTRQSLECQLRQVKCGMLQVVPTTGQHAKVTYPGGGTACQGCPGGQGAKYAKDVRVAGRHAAKNNKLVSH